MDKLTAPKLEKPTLAIYRQLITDIDPKAISKLERRTLADIQKLGLGNSALKTARAAVNFDKGPYRAELVLGGVIIGLFEARGMALTTTAMEDLTDFLGDELPDSVGGQLTVPAFPARLYKLSEHKRWFNIGAYESLVTESNIAGEAIYGYCAERGVQAQGGAFEKDWLEREESTSIRAAKVVHRDPNRLEDLTNIVLGHLADLEGYFPEILEYAPLEIEPATRS